MKMRYANKHPYGEWIKKHAVTMSAVMSSVPESSRRVPPIIPMMPVSNSIVPFPASSGNGNGSGKGAAAGGAAGGSTARPAADEAIRELLQPLKTFG